MEQRFHKLAVVLVAVWLVLLSVPSFGEEKSLPAPKPISPEDQSRLKGTFPRLVSFKWSNVGHATGYGIEIDHYAGGWSAETGRPTRMDWVIDNWLTMNFGADQPGA